MEYPASSSHNEKADDKQAALINVHKVLPPAQPVEPLLNFLGLVIHSQVLSGHNLQRGNIEQVHDTTGHYLGKPIGSHQQAPWPLDLSSLISVAAVGIGVMLKIVGEEAS